MNALVCRPQALRQAQDESLQAKEEQGAFEGRLAAKDREIAHLTQQVQDLILQDLQRVKSGGSRGASRGTPPSAGLARR